MDGNAKAGQFRAGRADPLTIATDIAGRRPNGWQASGRRDRTRLLRRAQRHSARVRRLRVGIPVVAAAGILILFLVTWFNPLHMMSRLPVSPGKVVVSGSKITMEAPRMTGFTSDNRSYVMTAEAAAQDLLNPNMVELTTVRAKVQLKDNGTVDVVAASGVLDVKSKVITLTKDIELVSSTGYKARLSEATFDIQSGHIVSRKPVEVVMFNGTLRANGLEVTENGALAFFDGGVSMTLAPEDGDRTGQTGRTDRR